jgi:hypothetical protein
MTGDEPDGQVGMASEQVIVPAQLPVWQVPEVVSQYCSAPVQSVFAEHVVVWTGFGSHDDRVVSQK